MKEHEYKDLTNGADKSLPTVPEILKKGDVVIIPPGQVRMLLKEKAEGGPVWIKQSWQYMSEGDSLLAIPVAELVAIQSPTIRERLEQAALDGALQMVSNIELPEQARMELTQYREALDTVGTTQGDERNQALVVAQEGFISANVIPGIFAYTKAAKNTGTLNVPRLPLVGMIIMQTLFTDQEVTTLSQTAKLLNARLGFLHDSIHPHRG